MLDGAVSGKTNVLETFLLHFFGFRQFGLGVNARMRERAQNDDHTGKAQQSGDHAEVIFVASKIVAARQLFAKDFFEPEEEEVNGKGD